MQLAKNAQTSAQFIKMNPWADKDDFQLMESITEGNKAAMGEFVARHINRMKSFALRYIGRASDAEDIVQEAFFKMWCKAPQWQARDLPPTNWLYRITYNLCIDDIRKRKLEVAIDDDIDFIDSALPENNLIERKKKELLSMALNKLPERQHTAILLCHYQGQSNRDAAAIMDISVDALESLLSRGRRKLKERLLAVRGMLL